MSIVKKQIFVSIISLLYFSDLNAHGNLSERIRKKTSEISQNPKGAVLYLERGYLYHQHHEYKKAIKDYRKSEHLGLKSKILFFRKSEAYYKSNKLKKALKASELCFEYDALDIKTHKQRAQIFFKLKKYKKSIIAYKYVIENTADLRPEDYIKYSEIVLAIDNENYKSAIEALDLGLQELGKNTITFQIKKLEYLKKSNQVEKVIEQYNMLLQDSNRKEFWYLKKAKYLFEVKDYENSNIALQQAKLAIKELGINYQNTIAIEKLKNDIIDLEIKLKS